MLRIMVEMPWMKKQKIASVQNEDMQHLIWKVLHKQGTAPFGAESWDFERNIESKPLLFSVFFKKKLL